MTLPSEIIKKAAIIVSAGWCQSGVEDGELLQAQDNDQRPIRLFKGGADKSVANEDAVRFTAYAAIAKVLADRNNRPEQLGLMWDTLWEMALADEGVVHLGGVGNHGHPLIAFNDVPGRKVGDVVSFLGLVANALEALEKLPSVARERDYAAVPNKHGGKR